MTVAAEPLCSALVDSRRRTLALVADFTGERWLGPMLDIVNAPLWEVGHVGWFQERWVLREGLGRASVFADGDADGCYDSMAVAHGKRWALHLPPPERTLRYLQDVLDAVLERLHEAAALGGVDERLAYLVRLSTYHEDMHAEALLYTRQSLGDPPPGLPGAPVPERGDRLPGDALPGDALPLDALPGDVEFAGGLLELGARPRAEFVFDNEKWAHPVEVAPFRLARTAVTEAEFAAFVDDGGYRRRSLWCPAGWRWRAQELAESPLYWRRRGGAAGEFEVREFDRWRPLVPHRAMVHVNWFEADAFCRWAGRRLPTEAEWELAARPAAGDDGPCVPWGGPWQAGSANVGMARLSPVDVSAHPAGDSDAGVRQLMGNVWEWTQSSFEPYPGFEPDAYRDYSLPWFGSRKVLRGGSFATQHRMLTSTHRNFFTPDRRDVFAGLRTAADAR